MKGGIKACHPVQYLSLVLPYTALPDGVTLLPVVAVEQLVVVEVVQRRWKDQTGTRPSPAP